MCLWHLSNITPVMFSSRIFLASRALAFDDNCPYVSSTASSRRRKSKFAIVCSLFRAYLANISPIFSQGSNWISQTARVIVIDAWEGHSFIGTVNVFAEALSLPPKSASTKKVLLDECLKMKTGWPNFLSFLKLPPADVLVWVGG